jgi:hypothetical protein
MNRFFGHCLMAAVVCVGLLTLSGCDDFEGTYTDSENIVKVEFKDGEKVYVSLGDLGTKAGTYEIDGDRVVVKIDGDTTVLTRKDDGSLDGGMMFGTLKKED